MPAAADRPAGKSERLRQLKEISWCLKEMQFQFISRRLHLFLTNRRSDPSHGSGTRDVSGHGSRLGRGCRLSRSCLLLHLPVTLPKVEHLEQPSKCAHRKEDQQAEAQSQLFKTSNIGVKDADLCGMLGVATLM